MLTISLKKQKLCQLLHEKYYTYSEVPISNICTDFPFKTVLKWFYIIYKIIYKEYFFKNIYYK